MASFLIRQQQNSKATFYYKRYNTVKNFLVHYQLLLEILSVNVANVQANETILFYAVSNVSTEWRLCFVGNELKNRQKWRKGCWLNVNGRLWFIYLCAFFFILFVSWSFFLWFGLSHFLWWLNNQREFILCCE